MAQVNECLSDDSLYVLLINFKGSAHFFEVIIPIIDGSNARDGTRAVVKQSFHHMNWCAKLSVDRSKRSTQVMHRPVCKAGMFVQANLGFAPPIETERL